MDIQELAKTLQQEGVDKGKQEAEKIIATAQAEAKKIIEKAEKDKQGLLAKAQEESEKILNSGKQNLELASRDVLLQLKKNIEKTFSNIVSSKVNSAINNEETIKSLLSSLISEYSKKQSVTVEVSDKISKELESWLVSEMKVTCKKNNSVAGFLVHDTDGGAIEVSADSVKDVITPYLNDIVKGILQKENKS